MANGSPLRVTEQLAARVRELLTTRFGDAAKGIRTEIQDGGLFLFVELELSRPPGSDSAKELSDAAAIILEAQIPARLNDYSWILNLTRNGEIVKSRSGGWSNLGR